MTNTVREIQVSIPSSTPGLELTGHLFVPEKEGRSPAVLFHHGMYSSPETFSLSSTLSRASALAQASAERGFVTLAFVARGYGTVGAWSKSSHAQASSDLVAAFQWLESQDCVDPDKIGLVGQSWGGYLAGMSLDRITPVSLLLLVPALYEEVRFNEPFGTTTIDDMRAFRGSFQGNDHQAFDLVRSYSNPTCTIIADRDELVPLGCQMGYILSSGTNPESTVHVLRDSGHSLSRDPRIKIEVENVMSDWFVRTLC